MKYELIKMTETTFRNLCREYEGICIKCRFVQTGCEPDSRRYECESCGERTVYGAEQAMIMGLIDFVENEDDANCFV
jgi:hypothetical protein